MGILEIAIIGIGLAMDAFAVSVCKGLSMKKLEWKKVLIIGVYFGVFQAIMPAIGYLLGSTFQEFIVGIDHWIAFLLLGLIGGNMIKEAFENKEDTGSDKVDFKSMIVLAVATSIDALTVGITFAFLNANLLYTVSIIGVITFILSMLGVKIGNKFGNKFQNKAEIMGGVILIIMGLKILVEHLSML